MDVLLAARNHVRQPRTQKMSFSMVHLRAHCGQPGGCYLLLISRTHSSSVSFRSFCCVNVRSGRVYLCLDMHNLRRSKSERNRTARTSTYVVNECNMRNRSSEEKMELPLYKERNFSVRLCVRSTALTRLKNPTPIPINWAYTRRQTRPQ